MLIPDYMGDRGQYTTTVILCDRLTLDNGLKNTDMAKHRCFGRMTPDTIPWTLGGVPYYDSVIIYYAVGN